MTRGMTRRALTLQASTASGASVLAACGGPAAEPSGLKIKAGTTVRPPVRTEAEVGPLEERIPLPEQERS